jgi:ABC-type multidrug transport system fused ATPase/permease subunit
MAGFVPAGPPPRYAEDKNKEPLPKNIKEVPGYLKKVTSAFFSRLFYIFRLVWETNPWILITMVAIAVINGVLPIFGTYITAQIINVLAEGKQTGEALVTAVGVLFIYQFIYLFLNRVTSDINRMVMNLSGELVTNHIRRKIMRKAKSVDVQCFDLPEFYEKLENANREAGMRPIQILNSTLNVVSNIISMVGYVAVLLTISVFAPLLVGLLALPYAIVNFVYRKKTVKYMFRRSKARRQMNYYSSSIVNKDMVKEMRLLGIADDFEQRYDAVFKDYFKGLKRIMIEEGVWNIVFGLLRIVANCALFYFVATLVMTDKGIQVGDYSFYTGALSAIGAGITTLISGTATVYEGTLFIENLMSFMKHESTVVSPSNPVIPQTVIGHTIEFKDVGFKYPGTERFVLKNFNFKIEKGETVSLVGLNGAGKTTIIKLLTRLYDPTEGVILLDGTDIKEYDVNKLYSLFGIVFQDFGRYAVTVKENIAYGRIEKELDDDAVRDAAVQSNSLEYIEKLPKKFDTPLMRFFEESGLELSVGQWQKLAVARAFYSDADILILDEPTASLDALAEQEIFRQFDKLREGKTTLFVSHRLSSAVDADRIVVISNGNVIEDGDHKQLMSQKGEYYKMFIAQAEKYNVNY